MRVGTLPADRRDGARLSRKPGPPPAPL